MLQTVPQMSIFLAHEHVNFRNGIDGLVRYCRQELKKDPFSGALFIFRNKRRTALKILVYDGQGFWLCYKRLSTGTLQWWPKKGDTALSRLAAQELQTLIWNGNPKGARYAEDWKRISPSC